MIDQLYLDAIDELEKENNIFFPKKVVEYLSIMDKYIDGWTSGAFSKLDNSVYFYCCWLGDNRECLHYNHSLNKKEVYKKHINLPGYYCYFSEDEHYIVYKKCEKDQRDCLLWDFSSIAFCSGNFPIYVQYSDKEKFKIVYDNWIGWYTNDDDFGDSKDYVRLWKHYSKKYGDCYYDQSFDFERIESVKKIQRWFRNIKKRILS